MYAVEEVEERPAPQGAAVGHPREPGELHRREPEFLHPAGDVGHVEVDEIPAGEDVRVAVGNVRGERPEHPGLVGVRADRVRVLPEASVRKAASRLLFGNRCRGFPGRQQERRIIVLERIVAGDADDRVPLGIGEAPLVLALDIDDAGPGGGVDFWLGQVVVVDGRLAVAQTPLRSARYRS